MGKTISETIGSDLGDKHSELCVLLPNGKLERPEPLNTTRSAFTKFHRKPATCLMKACSPGARFKPR